MKNKLRGLFPDKDFLFSVGIMIVFFFILNTLMLNFLKLDKQSYFSSIIFFEALKNPLFLGIIAITSILLFLNYKKGKYYKRFEWDGINLNLKYVIFFTALLLAWYFSAYDLNLYYNQSHYADRILLLLLTLLILLNPLFVIPMVAFTIIVASQFSYPSCFYHTWTDKLLIFNFLILFSSFLLSYIFRRGKTHHFVVAAFSMHGAYYFFTAINKLYVSPHFVEWIFQNDLSNLLVSSHIRGWLAFVNTDLIISIANILEFINIPLRLIVFLLEFGALFLLFHRKYAIGILTGLIFLHIGIFLASGIFFWKWILFNFIIILFLVKMDDKDAKKIFTRNYFLASIMIILFSIFYFSPPVMAWYDTPLNNFYVFNVVGQSGKEYTLTNTYMSPYDTVFTQNRFSYLTNRSIITGTYGLTKSYEFYEKVQSSNPEEVNSLVREVGGKHYNESKKAELEKFIQEYFFNLNQRGKFLLINKLKAPLHIYQHSFGKNYDFQEKVTSIKIGMVRTYFDDDINILINRTLMEIPIVDVDINELATDDVDCSYRLDAGTYTLKKIKRFPLLIRGFLSKLPFSKSIETY